MVRRLKEACQRKQLYCLQNKQLEPLNKTSQTSLQIIQLELVYKLLKSVYETYFTPNSSQYKIKLKVSFGSIRYWAWDGSGMSTENHTSFFAVT